MPNPAFLSVNQSIVAFGDTVLTNNPRMKFWDWTKQINGISISNPESKQFVVPAYTTSVLFSGTRATTLDGTSTFRLDFMSSRNVYRLAFTAGTDPSLATNSPLSFGGGGTAFTVVVNSNLTVTITAGAGTPFSSITSAMTIYIYGPDDGVVGGFNPNNAGYWKVLNATGTVLTLARPVGVTFNAAAEVTAAISATNNMIAFTPNVVQVGDKVRISAGFQVATQSTYTITAVTSKWVEFVSTLPLANETGILPGATGLLFYTAGKRYTRIECDQSANVYFNGAVDNNQQIDPWVPGVADFTGWQERVGPVWSISVANRSSTPMVCNLFTAE